MAFRRSTVSDNRNIILLDSSHECNLIGQHNKLIRIEENAIFSIETDLDILKMNREFAKIKKQIEFLKSLRAKDADIIFLFRSRRLCEIISLNTQ